MPLTDGEKRWCFGLLDKMSRFETRQIIFSNNSLRNDAALRIKTPMDLEILHQLLTGTNIHRSQILERMLI
jgi:hypothetical protein